MKGKLSRLWSLTAAGASCFALVSCNDDGRTLREPDSTTTVPVTLPTTTTVAPSVYDSFYAATQWPDGGAIPTRHGCDGEGLSPSLTWNLLPEATGAIGIAAVDSSNILKDGNEYILWVAVIPMQVSRNGIPEGAVPDDAIQGMNSAGGVGWVAPCPPAGETHRIDITVFALPNANGVVSGMSGNDMREQIIGAAIDEFTISGTYSAPE